jgi:hypothetical protein
MKNLILFLVLFIPLSLIAQDKVNGGSSASTNDQTDEWITKISSDSEMRGKMMEMMIVKTKGNKVEMMKLVNSFLADPEMHEMITSTNSEKVYNKNISLEPRGMTTNTIEVSKVFNTKPVPKK